MKRLFSIIVAVFILSALLQGCAAKDEPAGDPKPSETQAAETQAAETAEPGLTAEQAYQGVYNYCLSEYDWSITEEDPSAMEVRMEGATKTEYKVVFYSYTGAKVSFYVDKSSGDTRMVEYVPMLDTENEAGTINILDYLEEQD